VRSYARHRASRSCGEPNHQQHWNVERVYIIMVQMKGPRLSIGAYASQRPSSFARAASLAWSSFCCDERQVTLPGRKVWRVAGFRFMKTDDSSN